MVAHDLDVELSDEERAIREVVHRFAVEVLRPAGRVLDGLSAEDVIAEGSVLWEVHRRWDALGVRVLSGDPGNLGAAEVARLSWIINEELG
jgi:alkylation response protein AidB-like acyl-CoA dehydrogenase